MSHPRTMRTAIYCPCCGRNTVPAVKDSRPVDWKGKKIVRRRRLCDMCGGKYNTLEIPEWLLNEKEMQIDVIDAMMELLALQREDLVREMRLQPNE